VTAEDLIEEIVGEIGEEDRMLAPDVVRENDGSLVLRGSVSLEKAGELFGVEFAAAADEGATTIGGLINHVLGHVPKPGERAESGGVTFEVLEANQRKVSAPCAPAAPPPFQRAERADARLARTFISFCSLYPRIESNARSGKRYGRRQATPISTVCTAPFAGAIPV
jgi:hypothetical protein